MSRVAGRDPLTKSRILEAAVQIMDAEGLEKFSMRRLAEALGVHPNAIYHYFGDKEALIRAVTDYVLAECQAPTEGEWQERLKILCRSYRRVAHHHPKIFPLTILHPETVASDYVIGEAFLAILNEAGLDPKETVRAYTLFITYVTGYALEEVTGFLAVYPHEKDDIAALPPEQFPFTLRHLEDLVGVDYDADFEYGLEVLIAGL